MSVNLSIKDVPEQLAERLRLRAARNHRSLQGELMAIVEQAAAEAAPATASPQSSSRPGVVEEGIHPLTGRHYRVQGSKTFDQLAAQREAAGWKPHPSLAKAPLGVDIIRADRDSR
jgi:hypothetical protein